MAILWEKKQHGVLYQVRTAGKTRRLYADGVCHTQFHPDRIVTGSVWDLLLLPAFFLSPNRPKNVLMLGLGGGALVHLYQHFVKPDNITAVELDPIHIYVAKRFFKLKQRSVDIVQGDAHAWLHKYRGPSFDIIIDDLFSHQDGIPQRAVEANQSWFEVLMRNLNDQGLLVMNFADRQEFNASAYKCFPDISNRFRSVIQFSNRLLENRIVTFSKGNLENSYFRANLKEIPELDPKRNMPFSVRNLK